MVRLGIFKSSTGGLVDHVGLIQGHRGLSEEVLYQGNFVFMKVSVPNSLCGLASDSLPALLCSPSGKVQPYHRRVKPLQRDSSSERNPAHLGFLMNVTGFPLLSEQLILKDFPVVAHAFSSGEFPAFSCPVLPPACTPCWRTPPKNWGYPLP